MNYVPGGLRDGSGSFSHSWQAHSWQDLDDDDTEDEIFLKRRSTGDIGGVEAMSSDGLEPVVSGMRHNMVGESSDDLELNQKLLVMLAEFTEGEGDYSYGIAFMQMLAEEYRSRQDNHLGCILEETNILFPSVITLLLADSIQAKPEIREPECILKTFHESIPNSTDNFMNYATTYYEMRDKAVEQLQVSGGELMFLLSKHRRGDYGKDLNLLELMYSPIIRTRERLEFFMRVKGELKNNVRSRQQRKYLHLVADIVRRLQSTLQDLRVALRAENILKDVDSRACQMPKHAQSQVSDRSPAVSSILPPHVAIPRIRKNSNLDILNGSLSIKKGKFYKVNRRGHKDLRTFWLFSDILLYGSGDLEYIWKTRNVINVDETFQVIQLGRLDFEIHSRDKSFICITETEEEKMEWVEALNGVVWDFKFNCGDRERRTTNANFTVPTHSLHSDTCQMEGCSGKLTALFQLNPIRCHFCGKYVCRWCGQYYLPFPKKHGDYRACKKCVWKVGMHPIFYKQKNIVSPGSYVCMMNLPVQESKLATSDVIHNIEAGTLVEVLECRSSHVRITYPVDGYIPLFQDGKRVIRSWNIRTWNTEQVCDWLLMVADFPEERVEKFKHIHVNGEDLLNMNDDILKNDLGIVEELLRNRFWRCFGAFKHAHDSVLSANEFAVNSDGGESRSSSAEIITPGRPDNFGQQGGREGEQTDDGIIVISGRSDSVVSIHRCCDGENEPVYYSNNELLALPMSPTISDPLRNNTPI